jgi:PAB-dependent poly(A)-specific ribonuclease subunit 2
VTSFYSTELQRYTSYRGHVSTAPRGAPGNAPVKQLLFCDKGVISVSFRSVHCSSRRGVAQWHTGQNSMVDLRCMSFVGKGNEELLVAGCQQQMYRIDVEKGTIIETLASNVPFTIMCRTSQHICAAAHDGSIHLLDPKTLASVQKLNAYAGSVNDMDARGDYLLTCGWATQQYGGLGLERLVRVYDLKNQRPAAPIAFQQGAAFVKLHPKLSSTCFILSQSGAIHSIDVQNPDVPMMSFVPTYEAQITGVEVMPSGKGLAITDSNCHIILWGSPSKMQFNEYSKPTDFADPVVPAKYLDWSPGVPLNLIGMPYYREALLSGWANSLVHEVGAPPAKIDTAAIRAPRTIDGALVGSNPMKARRYQVEDTRALQRLQDTMAAPKFLSEKPRDANGDHETGRRLSEDIGKTLSGLSLNGASKDVLLFYRPVEIKYSKFGVDDFDFKYYNKTQYSGLETHIVNSYANPLLQLYRFTNVTRNLALRHTAQDCPDERCMLCELGFLIDMLEKARGQNCQATNFLKAIGKQGLDSALPVLEERAVNVSLTELIQNLNRFLLLKMDYGFTRVASSAMEIQAALATRGSTFSKCTHCSYEHAREGVWYATDLVYPLKQPRHNSHPIKHTFTSLLQDSVRKYEQQRGWCLRCQGYKVLNHRRVISATPAVLNINAAIKPNQARQLWSTPGFLPREIGIINANSQTYCYEGQDLQLHMSRKHHPIMVYELVGLVAEVAAGETQKSHLVAMVDVGVADPDPSAAVNWHLVNDFLVRPVMQEEALHFDPRWKLPAVITYQLKKESHIIDDSWKSSIDTSVLYRSVTQPAFTPTYAFRPLTELEPLPDSDTHCGIDAEFVRLLREEIDIGADGSRTITRPARSGLARVSVLRGDGPDQELPFIDDYIRIDEPIDDYLTQYSGLQPGDLSPQHSRFRLVCLKEVYKKLWVLLNLGCKFVGHGLTSDFRTINIHVPEAQVIDTQDLYSLGHRSQRKLSLRFLAWLLLKEDIQHNLAMGHDSIEDARTALKLWRKYLEYEAEGTLDDVMEEIWMQGRKMDFKVPSADNGRRLPETPRGSAPSTPLRQPASVARTGTPARSDFESPLK